MDVVYNYRPFLVICQGKDRMKFMKTDILLHPPRFQHGEVQSARVVRSLSGSSESKMCQGHHKKMQTWILDCIASLWKIHVVIAIVIIIVMITLPETNIAPENNWLEDEFLFGMAYFQVLC